MTKKEYDKKTKTGWISNQYNLKSSYIGIPESNVELILSRKQFNILKDMIKELIKQEGKQ